MEQSYVISLHNAEKIIPRCWEVPENAFLNVNGFTAVQQASLGVFSIRYCWIAEEHPDPEGWRHATCTKILEILGYQGEPKVGS